MSEYYLCYLQVVDIEIEKTMHKVKHHKAAHTVDVKQEMDIAVSNADALTETASVTPVKIKAEPVDDHDYGKAGSDNSGTSLKCHSTQPSSINSVASSGSLLLSHILSPVTCHVTVAHSPVQTIVSPSILSSQPLTFIPMATALQQSSTVQKLCPVTPPKNNIVQLQAVSPVFRPQTPSPTRNVVLKGFGSISASNISNNKTSVNNIQNNVIQVSPVKCSKNTNFIVPQPVILTNVSGNQPAALTGLQQASPSQGVKVDKTTNQSQKSNLIFLKCTDNQGKTYLIPQQLGSSVSSLQKDLNPGQVRISTPVSQSVLLSSNIMNNKAGVRLTGQISPNQVLSNVGTVFKSSKSDGGTSGTENGPILFIKPDNSLGKKIANTSTGKTVCLTTISSSVKMTGSSCKSLSPSQNVNVVNLKTGKQTAVCAGSPPVVRGQLKVTSQGLMQVQGQLQHQTVQNKQSHVNVIEQNRPTINGGLVNSTSPITQQKPQPVILFPTSTNNKLTVLPGKGKSLLSTSLMNLQVPQSNGNILMVNPPASSVHSSIGSEVLVNRTLTSENMETGKVLMNGDTNHVTESSSKLHNVPANHIVIVPVSSQTNVSMATKGQSSSATLSKHQNSSLISASSATNSHKDKSDIKACDKTMLIVLQNDKSTKNGACTSTQGQRSLSSLLMSKTNSPSLPVNIKETPVTITASNKTEKQIIVVDKEESLSKHYHDSVTQEKKIMLDPKKKRLVKSTEVKEKETIAPLR